MRVYAKVNNESNGSLAHWVKDKFIKSVYNKLTSIKAHMI